jgi:hypothetical protein
MVVMKYNDTCVESLHLRCTTDDEHSYRRMRRASHEALNKTRVTEFYPLHAKEAVRMIDGILQNPNKWDVEFLRWV